MVKVMAGVRIANICIAATSALLFYNAICRRPLFAVHRSIFRLN